MGRVFSVVKLARETENSCGQAESGFWERLVDAHYKGIYHFAFRFLGCGAEAEDVTQETFLSAFQSLAVQAPDAKVKSWLFTIARNKCIDRMRFWRRWRMLLMPPFEPQISSGAEDPAVFIVRLLAKLPVRQREVFILRHWHGFSTKETAEILGVNEGTVKSHLVRAARALKAGILRNDRIEAPLTTNGGG